MKRSSTIGVAVLSIILTAVALPTVFTTTASAQTTDSRIALQRGYRTGYSDGYMAGYRDSIDSLSRSYGRHSEYGKADRAFSADYGSIADYRDGYQQGFESGYDTGFDRKPFESTLPATLKLRGSTQSAELIAGNTKQAEISEPSTTTAKPQVTTSNGPQDASLQPSTILIPRETELILQLEEDLNTEQSRTGEKFTAKVVSPSELDGAIIEGRVQKISKPGKIKRRSELSLSFDRIVLSDNRWSNFSGTLVEVIAMKGDNIDKVDVEGTALGQNSYKSDAIKIGGATGVGALTGALVGGPVGAAVGAAVGAGFGVGAVVIDRGKHIRLSRGQQIRIKTAYETQIR